MIRARHIAVVTALAALAAASAAAQTQTPTQARGPIKLTLQQAEQQALQGHPLIRAGEYAELAAGENVREIRSAYFPTVFGSFTGAQAQNGTVITAGGLNNSSVLDRFAYGFAASQLITDFGRTSNLVASASLDVESSQQDVDARRATVMLDVDRAYFDALRAVAVLRVASETVNARQVVVDQVAAQTASGLKSTLDLSFAKVNLSEAQLLLVQAQNDVQSSYARLSAALGAPQTATYDLSEESLPAAPPVDSAPLVAQALRDRPDVQRERFSEQSALKFADAERSLWFPSLSLIGVAGMTPFHDVGVGDRYSAIGVNVTVPLTNGNLYGARRAAANDRASAEQQALQDLENRAARDVQIAWLNAKTAYQRLDLTDQLLAQASDALDLAQQRYNLGLSSVVEITQAQLNQTEAQIEQAAARYEYQVRSAALRYETGQLKPRP